MGQNSPTEFRLITLGLLSLQECERYKISMRIQMLMILFAYLQSATMYIFSLNPCGRRLAG